MANVIEKPRNGCALHGAVQTIGEIKGAVPIVHSNAGCAAANYLANKASGLGKGYVSGFCIPGTAVQERHVIFGGASRLREQIKNAVKVFEGDLYIVLNSCESAMVGDDIAAMTKEAADQDEPVIESLAAGFHGDVHYGYETIITDILTRLPAVKKTDAAKDARLVNLFGILPQQDIYFKGDLAEIKRLLKGAGIKANTFFGAENGVDEFARAKDASLTVVFSKWGLKAAQKLKELYDIPYLELDTVPTGIEEVENFISYVAERFAVPKEEYEEFLKEERNIFSYYLAALADEFYEEGYNRKIAIVGDERTVVQTAGFLKKYLGVVIETVVITDFFETDDLPADKKKEQSAYLANEVRFSQDTGEISHILSQSAADIILASSLEQPAAAKKNSVLLELSYPVYDKSILNKTYAGIQGALTLAEDYITAVKQNSRKCREALLEELV